MDASNVVLASGLTEMIAKAEKKTENAPSEGKTSGENEDADSIEEQPLDIGEHYLVRRGDETWREYSAHSRLLARPSWRLFLQLMTCSSSNTLSTGVYALILRFLPLTDCLAVERFLLYPIINPWMPDISEAARLGMLPLFMIKHSEILRNI